MIPSSYTPLSLSEFMSTKLSDVAETLGFSVVRNSYEEALIDTLLAYGADSVEEVTGRENIVKLRRLAEREAWRMASAAASARYNFSSDIGNFSRNQLFQMIQINLDRAERQASKHDELGQSVVEVAIVRYEDRYSD